MAPTTTPARRPARRRTAVRTALAVVAAALATACQAPASPLTPPPTVPGPQVPAAQRTAAALATVVPAGWPRQVRVTSTPGATSVARNTVPVPELVMGTAHTGGPWEKLRFVAAHEWGHLMAYRYGTRAYPGAPPAGWPGPQSAELFANCVAEARVAGYWQDVHGVGRCPAPALAWVRTWLSGPPPG